MNTNSFDPVIGKIYCKYNSKSDSFDNLRVVRVKDGNYKLAKLDNNYHIIPGSEISYDEEHFNNDIRKVYTVLKSDGLISLSNIISIKNFENRKEIRDIVVTFFPNNRMTTKPDLAQPYIVARQGITNLFSQMINCDDVAGMAVSLDTLPADFCLADFMSNEGVLSSTIMHTYKIDTSKEIDYILNNSTTKNILKDLFDHAVFHMKNIKADFKYIKKENDCINGYCNSFRRFLEESDFMGELYNKLGIVRVDFSLESEKPITGENKLLLSTLCGGIRINKAIPIPFAYDINMAVVKMKYILAIDPNFKLWIVPYTESENEIDADSIYKMTEQSTNKIHERLMNIVKAYDQSKK